MCITRGFMVGLGSNGFTNPIISSCLEISSTYNQFSSRFLFAIAIHHHNVCRVNSLHNMPLLLPPGDHALVSHSQTAFLLLYLDGKKKGLVTLHRNFLATKSPESGDC